ncbi:MAG: fused response regulator/phosphatase [Porticoccaceae bacterium]|nr:MAG: fused response regulator/phosphatase [Porticoccaceae bacterium]
MLLGHFPRVPFDWAELLAEAGWEVEARPEAELGASFDGDRQLLVARAEDGGERLLKAMDALDEYDCSAILPVLPHGDAERVLDFVRRGVADVLVEPVSPEELLAAVERVERRAALYRDNRNYNRALERANKELSESLNILRMDQIAGRQVQKSLLPQEPIVHRGYTVTHTILPSLYLSGDFVAYHLVLDRYILFFLADVSGHGASSAFVTVLLRFLLKRIIRRHVRERDWAALARAPEGFVEHLNRQILAAGIEKQITLFGGAIDTERHLLRYAVAAQVPMPVMVVDGDARFLHGRGKVVGLFEEARWETYEIALPERFRLVVVSDGLLETLPGATLGEREAELLARLRRHHGDHQEICRALGLEGLKEVADDVSILTIARGQMP